jgi:hypothetical protein
MCEESWKLGNHYFYHVNIISYAYHAAEKLPPLTADSIELKADNRPSRSMYGLHI